MGVHVSLLYSYNIAQFRCLTLFKVCWTISVLLLMQSFLVHILYLFYKDVVTKVPIELPEVKGNDKWFVEVIHILLNLIFGVITLFGKCCDDM